MKMPSHAKASASHAASIVCFLCTTVCGYSSLTLLRHAHHKRQGAVCGSQLQQHGSEAQGHHHPLIPILHYAMLWQVLQSNMGIKKTTCFTVSCLATQSFRASTACCTIRTFGRQSARGENRLQYLTSCTCTEKVGTRVRQNLWEY